MKYLALLILLTISVNAQVLFFVDTTSTGKDTRKMVSTKISDQHSPLPVQVAPGSWGEVGVTYLRGVTDTIGTSWVDTLSRKIVSSTADSLSSVSSYWWQVSIVADDTCEISTSSSFASGTSVVVLPDVPVATGMMIYSGNTNLYIRRYNVSGGAGTPRYYITYQGN